MELIIDLNEQNNKVTSNPTAIKMKFKTLYHYLLIVLVLTYMHPTIGQGTNEEFTPIDSIMADPAKYNNEFVTVHGQVTQFTPGDAQSTASYIIKGDFGSEINVTTMDIKPEVFSLYNVSGTVVIDPYTQQPYLIEKSKTVIRDATGMNNPMVLFGLFTGFLVIAVLIIVLIVRTSKPPYISTIEPTPALDLGGEGGGYDNDFKTIRIPTNSPKTLKFIPGKLVVTAGEDKGKEFMISGFPSPKGNIVSIGREVVTGEKAFSHIQLTEKTISRRQAEIIQSNGKIFLKNLSETNYTQLDGKELSPDEEVEVHPDSVIRMGELELKYVV